MNRLVVLGRPDVPLTGLRSLVAVVEEVELIPPHLGDFTRPLGLGDLLNPYSILTGLFAVSAFGMHGAIYLYLKTEGQMQVRIKGYTYNAEFEVHFDKVWLDR